LISIAEAKIQRHINYKLNARIYYQQNIGQINKETEETNAVTEARNKNDSVWIEIWHVHTTHTMAIKCHNTHIRSKVKISSHSERELRMIKLNYTLPSAITHPQNDNVHICKATVH